MSTPNPVRAEAARESARTGDGRFGTQNRSEAGDVDLGGEHGGERLDAVSTYISDVCNDADLPCMTGVLETVRDRGEVDDEAFYDLDPDDVRDYYDSHVGPAIDGIESDVAANIAPPQPHGSVSEHIEAISEEANSKMMGDLLTVVEDRGDVDTAMLSVTVNDVDYLYGQHVGPAVDRISDDMSLSRPRTLSAGMSSGEVDKVTATTTEALLGQVARIESGRANNWGSNYSTGRARALAEHLGVLTEHPIESGLSPAEHSSILEVRGAEVLKGFTGPGAPVVSRPVGTDLDAESCDRNARHFVRAAALAAQRSEVAAAEDTDEGDSAVGQQAGYISGAAVAAVQQVWGDHEQTQPKALEMVRTLRDWARTEGGKATDIDGRGEFERLYRSLFDTTR